MGGIPSYTHARRACDHPGHRVLWDPPPHLTSAWVTSHSPTRADLQPNTDWERKTQIVSTRSMSTHRQQGTSSKGWSGRGGGLPLLSRFSLLLPRSCAVVFSAEFGKTDTFSAGFGGQRSLSRLLCKRLFRPHRGASGGPSWSPTPDSLLRQTARS